MSESALPHRTTAERFEILNDLCGSLEDDLYAHVDKRIEESWSDNAVAESYLGNAVDLFADDESLEGKTFCRFARLLREAVRGNPSTLDLLFGEAHDS